MSHSVYGPSASTKWLNCPGAIAAEKGLPDTTSEFAMEGTRAHELAETCLATNTDAEGKATPEMAGYVQEYVDYVRALGGTQEYEQLVDYSDYVPGGWGTADAIVINKDVLHVVDLKYGKGVPVDAKCNPQGLLYALGALIEREMLQKFSAVVIHIHQPRLGDISVWEVTPEYVFEFGEWAGEQYLKTLDVDAPRVPGEKQCQWCKAKATCYALGAQAETALMTKFDSLTPVEPTPPEKLADGKLAFILEQKPLIVKWLNAIEAHVKGVLESGQPFPGFKLVHGRSNRRWVDEEAAARKLSRMMGKRNAYTHKLLSPSAAEKALGKEAKGKIKKLIDKPPGALTLVPETDKREAVQRIALEDFENIETIEKGND